MPAGLLNCPSPLPALPHVVMSVPTSSNFWTRLLPRSVTYTWPAPSVATQPGCWNWPAPAPRLPHIVTKVPQARVLVVHWSPAHASQQLSRTLTHALPPFGATHLAAVRLIAHERFPWRSVRQQVTKPGLRQVDRAAHRTTVPLQSFGSVPAFTAAFTWSAMQET